MEKKHCRGSKFEGQEIYARSLGHVFKFREIKLKYLCSQVSKLHFLLDKNGHGEISYTHLFYQQKSFTQN